MRIIFATGNAGKIREVKEIMADMGWEVLSLSQAGLSIEVEENGATYEENALIKARAAAGLLVEKTAAAEMAAAAKTAIAAETVVMADDSGLEIDYFNREPGIYSARYLGEDTPYSVKNNHFIERLAGVCEEQRSARFVCAIAAVMPDGKEVAVRATVEGRIGYEERGENGFGYDPIFLIPEYGKTMAELLEEEKNKISHRGKALRLMREELINHENFSSK